VEKKLEKRWEGFIGSEGLNKRRREPSVWGEGLGFGIVDAAGREKWARNTGEVTKEFSKQIRGRSWNWREGKFWEAGGAKDPEPPAF